MTTDREAACWLMAALLVVVLAFGAAGCSPRNTLGGAGNGAMGSSGVARWIVDEQAALLSGLVMGRGAADRPAPAAPTALTLRRAAAFAVVIPPAAVEPRAVRAAAGAPVAAGGALTDAVLRGLRAVAARMGAPTPGRIALGLVMAAVLSFVLQLWVLAGSLRPEVAAPRLTLGPVPSPFPRPPSGGAARPIPLRSAVVLRGVRMAQAA